MLEYEKEHGHCNVPQADSYKCILPGLGEDGSDFEYSGNLGTWLSTQRSLKKGTAGNRWLRADREVLLQQLVDQGNYLLLVFLLPDILMDAITDFISFHMHI